MNSLRLFRYCQPIALVFVVVTLYLSEIITVFPSVAHAETMQKVSQVNKHVVIISIPGYSFQELTTAEINQTPHLQWLVEHGAIGALNVRTLNGIRLEDSYLTMGSGVLSSTNSQFQAWNQNEQINGGTALQRYLLYQGFDPQGANILIPSIEAIKAENVKEAYGAEPGLLGTTLESNGIHIRVFGNSDEGLLGKDERYAPFMLMNEKGAVMQGDVSDDTLQVDPTRPYGVRTNYTYLLQQAEKKQDGPSVTLIELGDFHRLMSSQAKFSPANFVRMKHTVMKEIDAFIGNNVMHLGKEDALWIISPEVNELARKQKWLLSPILQYQPDRASGVFQSQTTKRLGITANIDIAPSLLEQFNLTKPNAMIGYPLAIIKKSEGLAWLRQKLKIAAQIYLMRPKILYPYAIYEITVLILSLLAVLLRWRNLLPWLLVPLISLLITTPVFMEMGYISAASIQTQVIGMLVSIVVWSVLTVLLYRHYHKERNFLKEIGWISGISVFLILLDGWTGAYAIKHSVIGYDVMIGARYYGIGNELIGVLIGAAVLFVSIWLQRQKNKINQTKTMLAGLILLLFILVHAAIVFYLAAPFLGTNAGGAITATVAFGVLWAQLLASGRRIKLTHRRIIALAIALPLAAVTTLWLLNAAFPVAQGRQSHIGRAMHLLTTGRLDAIVLIISRKLEMNWHLIGVSLWSKVLITSLIVMTASVLRPWGVFQQWRARYPIIMIGFSANTIAAFTALLVNDSGIVAAATLIAYVAVPMLLMRIHDISTNSP